MTIKELFSKIVNTPILELFFYLVMFSVIVSIIGWIFRVIGESETRNYYSNIVDREEKNKKFLKRSRIFFISLIIFNIVVWGYLFIKSTF